MSTINPVAEETTGLVAEGTTGLVCSECKSKFFIKDAEREHFEKKGWCTPKKCKPCRQLIRNENTKDNARRKSKGWGFK